MVSIVCAACKTARNIILVHVLLVAACSKKSSAPSVAKPNAGQSYYVAVDGSDANTGDISSPLRSINTALTKAVPGDTVFSVGALAVGLGELAGLGLPAWGQWLAFPILAVVALRLFRKPLLARLQTGLRRRRIGFDRGDERAAHLGRDVELAPRLRIEIGHAHAVERAGVVVVAAEIVVAAAAREARILRARGDRVRRPGDPCSVVWVSCRRP